MFYEFSTFYDYELWNLVQGQSIKDNSYDWNLHCKSIKSSLTKNRAIELIITNFIYIEYSTI